MQLSWFKKMHTHGNSVVVTVPKEIIEKARLKDKGIYEFSVKVEEVSASKKDNNALYGFPSHVFDSHHDIYAYET